MFNIIKLNEKDNIGIAPMDIPENSDLNIGIKSKTKVPYGHKISTKDIKKGDGLYVDRIVSFFKDEPIAGAYLLGFNFIIVGYFFFQF